MEVVAESRLFGPDSETFESLNPNSDHAGESTELVAFKLRGSDFSPRLHSNKHTQPVLTADLVSPGGQA
jgi:hypothetical protein